MAQLEKWPIIIFFFIHRDLFQMFWVSVIFELLPLIIFSICFYLCMLLSTFLLVYYTLFLIVS